MQSRCQVKTVDTEVRQKIVLLNLLHTITVSIKKIINSVSNSEATKKRQLTREEKPTRLSIQTFPYQTLTVLVTGSLYSDHPSVPLVEK